MDGALAEQSEVCVAELSVRERMPRRQELTVSRGQESNHEGTL